jgi:YfiR/HmsC-like
MILRFRSIDGWLSWGSWVNKCILMALLLGTAAFAPAQAGSVDEYQVRAAMLYNLARFIEWPAWKVDQGHPQFLVCVLGTDPIGGDIDSLLRDKTVGTKPLIVRHISSVDAAGDCHVLYVSTGERKNILKAAADLAKRGVLTISERPNSDSPDQVIGLPMVEEHVQIEVNLGAADRTGLTISSKLLHLATISH